MIIPNWNGCAWLPGLMGSLTAQQRQPEEVIVVDNGSRDCSLDYLAAQHGQVRILALGRNTGFAHAVNQGLALASHEFVALINTDVVLEPDWLARMVSALEADAAVASVACKMLELSDRRLIYDAGDVLRRDGACEQRGRFGRDDGRWNQPGEVFSACAGAALYRRAPVLAAGGFDERYFAYLEDVDLGLALRLAGWRCRYEPAVAWHAGESSSHQLPGGHRRLVERNTLLLVAKWFPLRWLPFVAYRQLSWAWHALGDGHLNDHLAGVRDVLPLLPSALRSRRRRRSSARVPIARAVLPRPIRGPRAGGHPSQHAVRATRS